MLPRHVPPSSFLAFSSLRGALSRLPFVPSFIRFLPTLDARLPLSPQPRRSACPTITGVYNDRRIYRERINHFVSLVRSNPRIYSREYYTHFYTFVCLFYTVGQPLTLVHSVVLWELSALRHWPARTLVLPLVLCACRLRSFRGCHPRPLFALFHPVAVAIVPPLSPLSVVSGQIQRGSGFTRRRKRRMAHACPNHT